MNPVNLVAHIGGKLWVGFSSFIFIPIYLRLLGIETYALIGFFSLLLTLSTVFLDGGGGIAINRELARQTVLQEKRNFLFTIERVAWGIALCLGIGLYLSADVLAEEWLSSPSALPRQAVRLMSLALLFQWLFSVYSNVLLGLQKHFALNLIGTATTTIRGVGAIFILIFISPTIEAFFLWQAAVSLLQSGVAAAVSWNYLKGPLPACFSLSHLKKIRQFCVNTSLISAFCFLLVQMDKIVLSHLLSVEKFGFYCLAASLAGGLSCITTSVSAIFFPKYSAALSAELYHKSCQLMSVLIFPVGLTLTFFSSEILLFWTQDPAIVTETEKILPYLALGTLCNGLVALPCALQLASNWTRLLFYQNLISAMISLPLLLWATNHYGSVGAAAVWLLQNMGYIFVATPYMHKTLLPGQLRQWYVRDIALPLIGTLAIILPARWLWTPLSHRWSICFALTAICLLASLASYFIDHKSWKWKFS